MTTGDSLLERLLSVRFEDGAWPLWRFDLGFRYGLKSLLHLQSSSAQDQAHFARAAQFLRQHLTKSYPRPDARLAAVGDIMWVPAGWNELFSDSVAAALSGADLRFANLETPVDPLSRVPRMTYANFNAPPSMLRLWRERAGPSVLSLCNNHALDCGAPGLSRSRTAIQSVPGLTPVGGVDAADAVAFTDAGSLRLAVVGMTFGINPWRRGGTEPAGVPIVKFGSDVHEPDWSRVRELFRLARDSADLLVVLPHWGFEFEYWPRARQRQHAYRLIELGADLILGTSPHVLQPIELVALNDAHSECPVKLLRPGPPGMALVAYSLGNFLSSMPSLACNTGLVLEVDVCKTNEGGVQIGALGARLLATVRRGAFARTTRSVDELRLGDRHRRCAARTLGPLLRGDHCGSITTA